MFAFNVPRTDGTVRHPVETDPRATMEWLERLPFANPVDAAQQLKAALDALNRQPLDEQARYALMALYRPLVTRAAASLEALLAESGVPPLAQQQQTGALLRELLIEHSIGYQHVLLALTRQASVRSNSARRMAEVRALLLAALRDVLVACYQTHSPPPAGLWQDMHQLYRLARASGMADAAVDDAPPASLPYRHALLLALADPPHMSHAELTHTQMFLDTFGALAVLSPTPTLPAQNGFPIATDCDRGPGPGLPPASLNAGNLWLETDALCRQLHDAAVRLRAGELPRRIGLPSGVEGQLCKTLSKQLLKLWRTGAQRTFKRYPAAVSTVQAVAGVSAIHRLLERVPPAAEAATPAAAGLDVHDAASSVHTSEWTISNDSAAGLALVGTPDAPLNLKVGDVLALRAGASAVWSLGVIRWIKMHDARQVGLGVERLSPQMQPVWVRPLRGRRRAGPEPALFIPGLPALKQSDRLLLPRYVYQAGMEAEIRNASRQYTLSFGRCLEHSPSFDLIDFAVIANEPPHD